MPIPKEATAIHHITDEMVQDAPSFSKVGEDFLAFCGENAILVGHNADAFDRPFIEQEFTRNQLKIPPWRYLDSLKWARKYRPDLPRHSLQHLREVFGVQANQAHRALDDVMVLFQVFSFLLDDINAVTALELMQIEASVRHIPFGKHKGSLLQDIPKSYLRWLMENGALDKQENTSLKSSLEKLGLLQESIAKR